MLGTGLPTYLLILGLSATFVNCISGLIPESTESTGPDRLVMFISLSTSDMLSLNPWGISVVADTSGPLGWSECCLVRTHLIIVTMMQRSNATDTPAMMYTYIMSNDSVDKSNV